MGGKNETITQLVVYMQRFKILVVVIAKRGEFPRFTLVIK